MTLSEWRNHDAREIGSPSHPPQQRRLPPRPWSELVWILTYGWLRHTTSRLNTKLSRNSTWQTRSELWLAVLGLILLPAGLIFHVLSYYSILSPHRHHVSTPYIEMTWRLARKWHSEINYLILGQRWGYEGFWIYSSLVREAIHRGEQLSPED